MENQCCVYLDAYFSLWILGGLHLSQKKNFFVQRKHEQGILANFAFIRLSLACRWWCKHSFARSILYLHCLLWGLKNIFEEIAATYDCNGNPAGLSCRFHQHCQLVQGGVFRSCSWRFAASVLAAQWIFPAIWLLSLLPSRWASISSSYTLEVILILFYMCIFIFIFIFIFLGCFTS